MGVFRKRILLTGNDKVGNGKTSRVKVVALLMLTLIWYVLSGERRARPGLLSFIPALRLLAQGKIRSGIFASLCGGCCSA